jgi:Ribbon-helix-helix protein, copG family
MARTQTMVQLSDDLLTSLDREAARIGCSRSALIRQAVEARLAASSEADATRTYVEGYRRSPQHDSSEDERRRHDVARRLDAEEDEAGLSW